MYYSAAFLSSQIAIFPLFSAIFRSKNFYTKKRALLALLFKLF
ncbi:hypothetical protein HMPREF1863_00768 [Aedoeadaptatus coxii]|uniref:Uncharacterized protein n=1 Tax=Aedoeadaptatus coxii TaxID=755172 RepID=A0A134AH46_9FIRM|nr:hypothetical protein HMPREF1863_00768 [Peptoniphilus coxii]